MVLLLHIRLRIFFRSHWHRWERKVHPEDMSSKSMSAKEVSEALPPHGFGVPDLYPDRVYDDSHDERYDSA